MVLFVAHAIPIILLTFSAIVEKLGEKRILYHTSVLTGQLWVLELLCSHPRRIQCELGVHRHIFTQLVAQLCAIGHADSKFVLLEEQLAIFLYTCVTGLTVCHVGEHFQRSNEMISW